MSKVYYTIFQDEFKDFEIDIPNDINFITLNDRSIIHNNKEYHHVITVLDLKKHSLFLDKLKKKITHNLNTYYINDLVIVRMRYIIFPKKSFTKEHRSIFNKAFKYHIKINILKKDTYFKYAKINGLTEDYKVKCITIYDDYCSYDYLQLFVVFNNYIPNTIVNEITQISKKEYDEIHTNYMIKFNNNYE